MRLEHLLSGEDLGSQVSSVLRAVCWLYIERKMMPGLITAQVELNRKKPVL